jgi:hypothetical protein
MDTIIRKRRSYERCEASVREAILHEISTSDLSIKEISENFQIDIDDVNDYSQWGKSVAMLYEVAKIFINEKK